MKGIKESIIVTLLILGLFFHTATTRAQTQTSIPSESTPPPGKTNYTLTKRKVGLLATEMQFLMDYSIERQIQRRLLELHPQIKQAMPKSGGVLVIARTAQGIAGSGEPHQKKILAVFIAASGATEEEAWQHYAAERSIPQLRAVEAATTQSPHSSPNGRGGVDDNPLFKELPPQKLWIPSGKEMPSFKTELKDVVGELRNHCGEERKRLENEWKSIEQQNKELNDLRRRYEKQSEKKATKSSTSRPKDLTARRAEQVARYRRQEMHRLKQWSDGQNRSIDEERATAEREARSMKETRDKLMKMHDTWRCPVGLTIEQCEHQQNAARDIHLKERQAYWNDHRALEAELAHHRSAFEQANERANNLANRFPTDIGLRRRRAEERIQRFEKQLSAREEREREREAKQTEVQEQEQKELRCFERAFSERLTLFSRQKDRLQQLETVLLEAERVLHESQASIKPSSR